MSRHPSNLPISIVVLASDTAKPARAGPLFDLDAFPQSSSCFLTVSKYHFYLNQNYYWPASPNKRLQATGTNVMSVPCVHLVDPNIN
jgi:hypothetical protein